MTDYFIHVDDYIAGRLSGSAKEAFEAEMSTNEELRRAVENHDIMDLVVDMAWEDDARQVAQDALQKVQKKEAKIIGIRKMVAVAASILLLAVAGYVLLADVGLSNNQIYADFYSAYMGDQSRGANNIVNLDLCDQGHILMDKNDFVKAIEVFNKSIQLQESCMGKSQWYLMLAHDHEQNSKERNAILEEILNNPKHEYYKLAKEVESKIN